MSRLLAIHAGLLGIVLVPLALSGPTALLLVPAHLGFSAIVALGAVWDGIDGWPERARRWGAFYLVATLAMVAALELGADARGGGLGYWGVPWTAALCWGWLPPVVAGLAGWWGAARQARRIRRIVHRRADHQTGRTSSENPGSSGSADTVGPRSTRGG